MDHEQTSRQPEVVGATQTGLSRFKLRVGSAAVLVAIASIGALLSHVSATHATAAPAAAGPAVGVSAPLQREVSARLSFTGQFSAVQQAEVRAQVGGALTEIRFKDGEVVHKGDLLFVIDPTPYEIRLSQASAELASATARLELATRELTRAETLKSTDAGSTENVEQRSAEKQGAQAAVDAAKAQVRDAQFDVDHCRITAPFTGRIGTHTVSVGNLVAGSRAATSPTTLLATLVSLNPMYVNFDMSEADYMKFMRGRASQQAINDPVELALADETAFAHHGTLDFVDNALERSSGTIHARATVPNPDLLLTPGGFARVRLDLTTPTSTLLVPDTSVLADQSDHIVLTVNGDGVVTPKKVELGAIRGGLRVIASGLAPNDQVIVDSIPSAAPGSKVIPHAGTIRYGSDQE